MCNQATSIAVCKGEPLVKEAGIHSARNVEGLQEIELQLLEKYQKVRGRLTITWKSVSQTLQSCIKSCVLQHCCRESGVHGFCVYDEGFFSYADVGVRDGALQERDEI